MRTQHNTNLCRVASNIRKWRNIIGIKQEQLADLIEISTVSMSKIENGKTDIPLKRLFSIAEALGIEVELLFLDPVSVITKGQHKPVLFPVSRRIYLNSESEMNGYKV